MYSGKYVRIKKAALDTGILESELIGMGLDGDISIYAWDNWFREDLRYDQHNDNLQSRRHSIDTPVLIDDEKHLARLKDGKTISFGGNAEFSVVCYRDSTDDDYLDGVVVTQANLYCLKSDIEELKHKTSSAKPKQEVLEISENAKAELEQTNMFEGDDGYDAPNNHDDTKAIRQKRIPSTRDTSESLVLIEAVLDYYKIEYLDQMKASTAWGKVVSKDYPDEGKMIKNFNNNNREIELNGGEILEKTKFSEKYRSRFEKK